MKKFIIIASIVVLSLFLLDHLYYYAGVVYIPHSGDAEYFCKAEGDALYLDSGSGFEAFTVKGVNLGSGKPGYFGTENAITKEEYLTWFQQIQDMGANVIRIYTLAGTDFYEAFYDYNLDNPTPLYLIHGVQVDSYLVNSVYSALDEEFYDAFWENCRMTVDAIHGRIKQNTDTELLPVHYRRDISPWVCGYILGIEWDSTLVTYTDYSFAQQEQFSGTYFYTEDASNFEIFLAFIGEAVAAYETEKYGTQRPIAFSNWANTDPLDHSEEVILHFEKSASIDVEHIKCTDQFAPGQFASYHIYPYYPDYYGFLGEEDENSYLQYLTDINAHHTIPVVISEFGVPSSRGMAARDELGRNQGGLSETEQGEALVSMYRDIVASGCAGAVVFSWQDEWFKHSWNTMSAVNLDSAPYWSDYQSAMQYYGLLSFDPGAEESICIVNGDRSEWSDDSVVSDDGDLRLSMMYDEKFIYFLVERDGFSLRTDTLYIPIDITPKSGSTYAENLSLEMSDDADFIIEINSADESRVWVQERYDMIGALYYDRTTPQNIFSKVFPEKDSPAFTTIRMLLQNTLYYRKTAVDSTGEHDILISFEDYNELDPMVYRIEETYETGKLTYGNADPNSDMFNSLADFCAGIDCLEIRIPWSLLNVADPSQMRIHDDYYERYGVEYLRINSMAVGVGDGSERIEMASFDLSPLGKKPTYHERLKESYYILRSVWSENAPED